MMFAIQGVIFRDFWGCQSYCIFLWGICCDGHNNLLEAYILENFALNHVSFSRWTFVLNDIGKSLVVVVLIIRCSYRRLFFNCKEIFFKVAMKNLSGMPGTASGLMLQVGQFIFFGASIVVMVTGNNFSNYTTLWILLQCQLVY